MAADWPTRLGARYNAMRGHWASRAMTRADNLLAVKGVRISETWYDYPFSLPE